MRHEDESCSQETSGNRGVGGLYIILSDVRDLFATHRTYNRDGRADSTHADSHTHFTPFKMSRGLAEHTNAHPPACIHTKTPHRPRVKFRFLHDPISRI